MCDRELTERQRQCLEGRQKHMIAKEIGRQLNISHNTVIMHWRLARLKLRSAPRRSAAEREVAAAQSDYVAPPSWRGLRSLDRASALAAIVFLLAAWMTLLFLLSVFSVMVIQCSR